MPYVSSISLYKFLMFLYIQKTNFISHFAYAIYFTEFSFLIGWEDFGLSPENQNFEYGFSLKYQK